MHKQLDGLGKPTKIERAKQAGDHLRGTIKETLQDEAAQFTPDDGQLLKFHGIYQQDDRDTRKARRADGLGKDHSFMVRLRLPGGRLSAQQYLGVDDIADEYGAGAMRLTVRQGIQFHRVYKKNLKAVIAGVNERLISTFAACGDVTRNVMCCPAPAGDGDRSALAAVTTELSETLCPKTRAYHEVWMDEERVAGPTHEPLYGDAYLPRKFKVAVATANDNCIDVHTHDAGLIAVFDGGSLAGFNLLVGGGLGMTTRRPDTFARLADPLGFVEPEAVVEAVKTVVTIFRDFGHRTDRRHARLKYLIHEKGLDWFRAEFASRLGRTIPPPVALEPMGFQDHLGSHDQSGGRMYYGVFVENGRVIDRGGVQLKTAFRAIVERHAPGVRITPQQNILFTDLAPDAIETIETTLRSYGVKTVAETSAARRHSMACPALPTCGLAIGEAERALPGLIDDFEPVLAELGLDAAELTIRMTGCPNGCVRPYTADIAYVARGAEHYDLLVGGRLSGDRLVDRFKERVTLAESLEILRPLLAAWAHARKENEGFGDYYQRTLGTTEPRRMLRGGDAAPEA